MKKTIPRNAIKIHLPDIQQEEDYSCGASALRSICMYFGKGPADERQIVKDLKMDKRFGSHPFQIKKASLGYGLNVKEVFDMNIENLKEYIDKGRPVLVMIQAWGPKENAKINYENRWKDGHWVIAIGYDSKGVYFEDPSLLGYRGFIDYESLGKRWHDEGPHGKHIDHYGMVIWGNGVKNPHRVMKVKEIK